MNIDNVLILMFLSSLLLSTFSIVSFLFSFHYLISQGLPGLELPCDFLKNLCKHLHNYFDIHVCLSLRRPSIGVGGSGVTSFLRVLSCSEFQKLSQTAAD